MQTNVYVDGFNLDYGCVRGTPYRWLDLAKLCQLMLPITMVQKELGHHVGVLNPQQITSRALSGVATFYKPIRAGVLRASQFPPTLTDRHGTITKPATWPIASPGA